MRADRFRTWAVVAAACVLLAASACHKEAGHVGARPTGPRFVPSGTLLVDTHGFSQHLISFQLPGGPSRILSDPASDFFGQFRLGAAWGPGGVAYTMEQSSFGLRPDATLFRMAGQTPPEPIGGVVRGGSGFAFAIHTAVTWSCVDGPGSVFVLDVAADNPAWDRYARGCGAGISPDGRTIAFIRGRDVWQGTLNGGHVTRVLAPGDVPSLKAIGIDRFQQTPGIALGSQAMAVAAGSPRQGAAIVVVRANRGPRVVPLGNTTLQWMAWQPKGRLLAFADRVESSQVTEVRTFDPVTGAVREVAVTQSFGAVWSPDGRVLAIFKGASVVAFVDADGVQLASGSVEGGPRDWKS